MNFMHPIGVFKIPNFTENWWLDFNHNFIFLNKNNDLHYGRDTLLKLPFFKIANHKLKNGIFIQPLLSNWLFISPFAHDENICNAKVYSSDGVFLYSFHAGDNIADVQTTSDGKIWISFIDEGIFTGTIGGSGLICLNEKGKLIYEFDSPSVPRIDDCYALNVLSNGDVLTYYYSEFSLVHLHNFQVLDFIPHIPISGSHGFAFNQNTFLFCGAYGDKKSLFLYHKNINKIEKITPLTNNDTPLDFHFSVARDNKLYLSTHDFIYEYAI